MATRAEIEARMARILNRTDFGTDITIWFDRAYTALQRRFNFKCMEVTETFAITEGINQVIAPTDIKKSLHLYTYDPVTDKAVTIYRETFLGELMGLVPPICVEGYNGAFTNWYGALLFDPPATAGVALRYDYHRFLTPVDNDWFMTRAEDFLVYRGLAESAPYLGADQRLMIWQAFAKEAYDELWRQDLDQAVSGPMVLRG